MTVVLPPPADLPMPPGDLDELRELVREVRGAGFWLGALGDRLAGPAASAPGWLGADGTAAAEQVVRVAALTREAAEAVQAAESRLGAHADLLADVRRQVSGLRAEQDDDVRAAWRRLGRYVDLQPLAVTDSPAAYAVVADFESAERSRSRRCRALAEDVEEDAAATGRVLAEACAVVGGQGTRGDAARVVAYLATELPGWGDLELARRARAVAGHFFGSSSAPEEMEQAAAGALPYAALPAFADALLAVLGEDGVRRLLAAVGANMFEGSAGVPRLLATVLSSASGTGPEAAVLGATFARPDDEEYDSATVVAGMAAVLVASRSATSGGLRTATVSSWGRQLLLWEHDHQMPAGAIPDDWGSEVQDPAAVALEILAERADPAASAALLGDARAWETLLGRAWPDDGVSLAAVVAQAGQEPGPAGERAVVHGLVVLGGGLVAGDPSGRTVLTGMAAMVSGPLGAGVAAHASVVAGPLVSSGDGKSRDYVRDLLRGLGIISTSRPAAALVARALDTWIATQPPLDPGMPSLAITLPSAWFAVQAYGQQLPYVLAEEDKAADARRAAWLWNEAARFGLQFVSKALLALGIRWAGSRLARAFGVDGGWDSGVEPTPRFTRDDAIDAAVARMTPSGDEVQPVIDGARDSYDGALRVVGWPEPPENPTND